MPGECQQCGKPTVQFVSSKKWAKFCRGLTCRTAFRNSTIHKKGRRPKQTYTCRGCGIQFQRQNNSSRDAKKYHSRDCAFNNSPHFFRRTNGSARDIADAFVQWVSRWKVCQGCGCMRLMEASNKRCCNSTCLRLFETKKARVRYQKDELFRWDLNAKQRKSYRVHQPERLAKLASRRNGDFALRKFAEMRKVAQSVFKERFNAQ
jgi:hypothetical protein